MPEKTDIVVAGHICCDMIPRFRKAGAKSPGDIFIPGKLVTVDELVVSTGGAVSNTGTGLARMGASVELMAKVGDDPLGKIILDKVTGEAGTAGIRTVKGEVSSYTMVLAPPGIDRIFLHNPGTNDTFGYDDLDFDIIKNAKVFHLGYPPIMKKLYSDNGPELVKIFKKVKSLGVTASLDMVMVDPESEAGKADWDGILKKVLPHVDIFLPSFEEICFMLDRKRYNELMEKAGTGSMLDRAEIADFESLADRCASYGAGITGIKCAHLGFYAVKDGTRYFAPTFRAGRIASAAGAGDCAIAGFLRAYLDNMTEPDMPRMLRCANAAGALNLRSYDAVEGIRDWSEVLELAGKKTAEMNAFNITEPGWEFDSTERLWMRRTHN